MKKIIFIYIFLAIGSFSDLSAQTYNVPEILYYKFNNGVNSTPNYAVPGQGTNPAALNNMFMGPGGQFDSALMGNGGNGTTTFTNSGWNMNIGASSWTISLWIANFPSVTGTSYLFGNDITTSFRCFTNGAAGASNITLRGNGITNTNVNGVLPGPSVVHFVYDASVPEVRTYVNGVFQSAVSQAAFNLSASVPFKIGSYGTATSIPVGSLIDEFRFYSRALDANEITGTWNRTLPATISGINNSNPVIPSKFNLEQNYPNPFNPVTKIRYSIPVSGSVKLVLYDILGNEVLEMVNEVKQPGNYLYEFNASNLSSGVYSYKLWVSTPSGEAGNFVDTKMMIVLK